MRSLRTFAFIGFCALSLLFVAACGDPSTGTSGTITPADATSTAAYGSTGSTPTTADSSSTGDIVKTTTITVQGKQVSVLTNAQGMTLYTFTPDTATTTACTGACATTWPPLLSTGSGTPTGATGLTVVTDANGMQVQLNGHFLYTYAADTAPGQANGQGVGGKWFVATTSAASGSTSTDIKTATATVDGKSETILVEPKGGLTLYYFKPDTASTTACTGSCAAAWPPLVTTNSTPTGTSDLTGIITAIKNANGQQVQYNGHFLYTYAGDSAPGQTTGQGLQGKWYVATPDIAKLS